MSKSYEEKTASYHANLDKILSIFFKNESISLAQVTMPDGTVIEYESTEVGTPVMVIVEGQEPTAAPDGEYKISETETLIVAEGVIAEVKTEEVEEVVEEEMEEGETPTETPAEEPVEEIDDPASIFNIDKLKELIDLTKEGFHTISFSVANGKIEWGNIYSESFQELSEQVSAKDQEIADMKLKFEQDLKLLGQTIKETQVIQAPVETKPVILTKKDLILRQLDEQRAAKSIY